VANVPPTNFCSSWLLITLYQLSQILKLEGFCGAKKTFFLGKKSARIYIILFSQNRWSFIRCKSVENFCARIFRDFARISDKSKLLAVRLHPQLPHHWVDSATLTSEISLQQKQNIRFFQLSTPFISVASPLIWIIYVVNNNFKNSCLLHLWEIHNSDLTYVGSSQLKNLAELLKDVWVKTQDSHNFQ